MKIGALGAAAGAVLLLSLAAQASDTNAALVRPASSFAAAFNAGSAVFPAGVFTEDCTVQDEFAPYSWDGHGSVRTWYTATLGGTTQKSRKAFLAGHQHVVLDAPETVRIRGNDAYVVLPATLTYDYAGRHHLQHLVWTLGEVKTASGWRIRAQGWALLEDKVVWRSTATRRL